MFKGKRDWMIAFVIAGALIFYQSHKKQEVAVHSNSPTRVASTDVINKNRKLSVQEQKFAILGKGFSPMQAPCTLNRYGHEDLDRCADRDGVTYSFDVSHQNTWQIKRVESLSKNVDFSSIIAQVSAKYGAPASTGIACQAIWGSPDLLHGISYRVQSVSNECEGGLGWASKGIDIFYELYDADMYHETSHHVDAKQERDEEAAKNSELSTHKF